MCLLTHSLTLSLSLTSLPSLTYKHTRYQTQKAAILTSQTHTLAHSLTHTASYKTLVHSFNAHSRTQIKILLTRAGAHVHTHPLTHIYRKHAHSHTHTQTHTYLCLCFCRKRDWMTYQNKVQFIFGLEGEMEVDNKRTVVSQIAHNISSVCEQWSLDTRQSKSTYLPEEKKKPVEPAKWKYETLQKNGQMAESTQQRSRTQ